ncbi:tyrosine-type recombinase/integrase [Lacticaseibacillus zhaodongensis]|uniref:tyrosine-type recombinase/integrase n=1 Tax=Lacticaseibacillus zhaodongensis TaxID=2668065 RepID=UPI0012D3439B|nr:tyrosine-type recombinase/integrase [Lacticaseibacillus zhaodongensis]
MVSYRKRGESWQYEISYKDLDGKYKKLRKSGFHFKSDAELAASQIKSTYIDVRSFRDGNISLAAYFEKWIKLYKEKSVSAVTLVKYYNTLSHIQNLFGNITLHDLNRIFYQEKINEFAQTHAPRTVATFHKQIRAAVLDALDEKIILSDPTRKVVITGRKVAHPQQALNYNDWRTLVNSLDTSNKQQMIIYLAAVTGLRFAEVVGLTLKSIDFDQSTITVSQTWDYKYHTGFKPTKNKSSIRTIPIDSRTTQRLKAFTSCLQDASKPIFAAESPAPVSAEINKTLTGILKLLGLPRITFHGLRHTHASVLLYQGVSVLSVSKRLGHANITTTQSTYLHVIKELEQLDNDKIISVLNNL